MREPSPSARPSGKSFARREQTEASATLSNRLFLMCAAFCAPIGGVMLTTAQDAFLTPLLHLILGIPFSLGGGAAWLVSRMRKPSDPFSPFLRWGSAAMLALPWAAWLLSESRVFSR